eukprot:4876497-Prymnesium_polylepis.1
MRQNARAATAAAARTDDDARGCGCGGAGVLTHGPIIEYHSLSARTTRSAPTQASSSCTRRS